MLLLLDLLVGDAARLLASLDQLIIELCYPVIGADAFER